MQLKAIVAILTTVSSTAISVNAGGFSRSCTNYHIQGNNILRATCGNGRGQQVDSALDLNSCIGIGPVNLDCIPNGNYAAQEYSACLIRTGTYMRCQCPGGVRNADLDACVSNTWGLLTCP